MTKILVISGKKSAGKDTSARFIYGLALKALGFNLAEEFIDNNGNLLYLDENNNTCVLNPDDFRPDVRAWIEKNVSPYIKLYSFADPLKEFSINMLGLKPEQAYGTDEEKNSATEYTWEQILPAFNTDIQEKYKDKSGPMSGREILQFWGTDIFRAIDPDIHVKATRRKINCEQPHWAVVKDGRFPNEIEFGGDEIDTLRLKRSPYNDNHISETALNEFPEGNYSAIIDNQNLSIAETNELVYQFLVWIGWVEEKEAVTS